MIRRRKKRVKIEEWMIEAIWYYSDGTRTKEQIARILGISDSTVGKYQIKFGFTRRPKHNHRMVMAE